MNKTAIKNFAIWARNKLIADITYKAGLLGITEKEIKEALPQSTKDVQFFDIGTKEPYSISRVEIKQREKLEETIKSKAKQSDYKTAYKAVVEEVAYTWFNRLIAVRFMEVNDYLPSRIRVLSSESITKIEPDLVTTPFDSDLDFSPYEKDRIVQLKHNNKLDELFQMLFIKQCNALNAILPNLFEKTSDYTELLLNVSFTDKDGVVYRLVHDILEVDFKIRTEADEEAIRQGNLTEEEAPRGQVEIIGWLYQYYNTEPKDEAFALLKKNVKITKERIPAATQLFTPDWIVRYMVENSLGRLWLEGHPNDVLKSEWKYYLDEAEQEEDVQRQLEAIREEYKVIKPEDIKVIDPCMGSGHILVYAFDVLMQIYESCGYSQRDAARSILVHNIYGLDIDNRAYQLAYFAIMMKARQYNRRILDGETDCNVYSIQESNGINRNQLRYFGAGMSDIERNTAILQVEGLLDTFIDAKEYGSILNVENFNWELLYRFIGNDDVSGQLSFEALGMEDTKKQLHTLVERGATMTQKYDVVVTNPPYMGGSGMNNLLSEYLKKNYPAAKSDLFAAFTEKGNSIIKKNAYNCMVTMQSWMFLSSFEKMRENIIAYKTIINLMHMDNMVMGIAFGTAVANFRNSIIKGFKGTYNHIKNCDIEDDIPKEFPVDGNRFVQVPVDTFTQIPGMPIAYWVSEEFSSHFTGDNKFNLVATAKSGLSTTDNNRFLRFWYEPYFNSIGFHYKTLDETLTCSHRFIPHPKGGPYRKWYGNLEYVVNWYNNRAEIKKAAEGASGGRIVGSEYYFRKGLTWSDITSSGKLSVRYMKSGSIFNSSGPACFCNNDNDIWWVLGYMNSKVVNEYLKFLAPTYHFNAGPIERLPLIIPKKITIEKIDINVKKNVEISKNDWDSFETSCDFVKHPLLNGTRTISEAFERCKQFIEEQFNQLKANEEELNRIFIDIYGLQDELTPEVEDKDVTIRKADLERDIRSFISYAVGCMFGRYSLDLDGLAYAGGDWDSSKYITFIPDKDNILPITDEEYFEDDIVGLFVAFVKKVYGSETLEQNLDFIAKALGNKGNTSCEVIRNYFLKDFFKDHCKVYQKRPIYWLFDSGKADGFKALVYMHRYDENTIGNLRIDYLHRMQRVYESEIARMQETIENSNNAREVAAAEKRKEKLIKQLKETKEYDEKIAHLALARISIDLDDGVKVNYEKVQTGSDGKKLEVLAKI